MRSSRTDEAAPASVVIGLGSPLQGDDGLGLAALERLRTGFAFEPAVELIDGGTWGLQLLPAIESAERVMLLDAIRAGGTPGTAVTLERDELPRLFSPKLSPHQIDLREVLAVAELRGRLPHTIVALGLEPERVALGVELSPRVAEGLGGLVERACTRLAAWGHRVRPRDEGDLL